MIPSHLLWWSVFAVLLFWTVGAYNRLVRLRADALRAFTPLGQQLQRFTEHVLASAATDAGVYGAATQFAASLAVARGKPLDAEAMAALDAASAVLRMAWQRLCTEHDENRAVPGLVLPVEARAQWDEIQRQAEQAAQEFASAIGTYNAAVGQFPAALLAWLFGFRQAAALALNRD